MLDYLQKCSGAVKFGYALFGLANAVLFTGILGSVLTFSPLLLIVSSSCLALFSLAHVLIKIKDYRQLISNEKYTIQCFQKRIKFFDQRKQIIDDSRKKLFTEYVIEVKIDQRNLWSASVAFGLMVSAVLTLVFALYPLPVLAVCIGMIPAVSIIVGSVVNNIILACIDPDNSSVMANFIKTILLISAIYAIPTAMFVESVLMGSHAWGLALFVVSCITMGGYLIKSLWDWCQGKGEQARFSENSSNIPHKEITRENSYQLNSSLMRAKNALPNMKEQEQDQNQNDDNEGSELESQSGD